MLVAHSHPFKIVTQQSKSHLSFWITTFIPPKPMKVKTQTGFMDDFGSLVQVDYMKFAILVRSDAAT